MNRNLLLHPTVISGAYAFLIVLTNWQYNSHTEKDNSGVTTVSFDGACLSIFVSLAAIFYFGHASYRRLRLFLDNGTRIPRSVRFIDWSPCVIMLPLLFQLKFVETQTASPAGVTTMSWGYGSNFSFYAIVIGALAIAIFQISVKLLKIDRKTARIPATDMGLGQDPEAA